MCKTMLKSPQQAVRTDSYPLCRISQIWRFKMRYHLSTVSKTTISLLLSAKPKHFKINQFGICKMISLFWGERGKEGSAVPKHFCQILIRKVTCLEASTGGGRRKSLREWHVRMRFSRLISLVTKLQTPLPLGTEKSARSWVLVQLLY